MSGGKGSVMSSRGCAECSHVLNELSPVRRWRERRRRGETATGGDVCKWGGVCSEVPCNHAPLLMSVSHVLLRIEKKCFL